MKKFFAPFALAGFLVTLSAASFAGTNDKLHAVEKQVEVQKKKKDSLDLAVQEASQKVKDLQKTLIKATRALQKKEAEQDRLEDKLDQLTQEIIQKSEDVRQDRHQLSLILSALIELATRPPESLFLQERVRKDHIHRSILLRSIMPRLKERAQSTAADLAALYELRLRMESHKRIVAAARKNLKKQQDEINTMIALRQGFLRRTEEQKDAVASRLASLNAEARNLRQLMEKVAPAHQPKVKKKHKVEVLIWPVVGKIKKTFGEKDADGVKSSGLTFDVASGAPIVAPYPGRVVFAGPFRGYGQIMILQHDNGYYTFLSGFGRIDAEMGQSLEAGEPLGVVPVVAKGKASLYFEWRDGDHPVDPKRWKRKKT